MSAPITVVGLGPAGLDRIPLRIRRLLESDDADVVVRTTRHPAAAELAHTRPVESCDDLYETAATFDAVYGAITARVLERAGNGPVIYAVPGSAVVGERSVAALLTAAAAAGHEVVIEPGESFLDLVWLRTGCDPIATGAQILDGRELPDPLQLHIPTVITQVDRPEVLADVVVELGRVLPDSTEIVVLDALGSPEETVLTTTLDAVGRFAADARTTLFVDPPPNGWVGLVATNRLLRELCPWDQQQTHHSLLKHLIEETYETVEAIERLPDDAPDGDADFGAYAELEEELGDLLLQIVFHATLAEEPGAFGVEEVAEGIRRKLVSRHPHVFGDAAAADAAAVNRNWEAMKTHEKQRSSALDDIPLGMPALARADKLQRRAAALGFDWPSVAPVLAKLREEIEEVELAMRTGEATTVEHEVGDVLFSVVNLARHTGVEAEVAFRRANRRFEDRFRAVERLAASRGHDIGRLGLDELDALWDDVKQAQTRLAVYGSLAPGTANHHMLAGLDGAWSEARVHGIVHNAEWEAAGGYPAFEYDPAGPLSDVLVFEAADLPLHRPRLDAFEATAGYEPLVIDAVDADGRHYAVTIYVGPS